jgi:hypothetical protein
LPRKDAAARRRRERSPAYRAKTNARVSRWQKTHPDLYRERKRARRSRHNHIEQRLSPPPNLIPTVVTADQLRRPTLLYLDKNGTLHLEREHSAEELIALYQKGKWQPC